MNKKFTKEDFFPVVWETEETDLGGFVVELLEEDKLKVYWCPLSETLVYKGIDYTIYEVMAQEDISSKAVYVQNMEEAAEYANNFMERLERALNNLNVKAS